MKTAMHKIIVRNCLAKVNHMGGFLKTHLIFLGSPVLGGKKPKHKGHYGHKGGKGPFDGGFFFVTFVSFVVENGLPVKNGRPYFYFVLTTPIHTPDVALRA
jgi:hypothetical protein